MLLFLLVSLAGCTQPAPVLELNGETMGTRYSVKLGVSPEARLLGELGSRIQARLAHVNALMSTYEQNSELSSFNRATSTEWIGVSPELAEVVARAQTISELSDGAFDATILPVVELWGFGAKGRVIQPPAEIELAAVQTRIGYQKLQWRLQPPGLRKTIPDIQVDLSAIAKGYAVDQIARELEKAGIESYLVEIGGELRSSGRKSDGGPWRIAIQVPDAEAGSIQRVMETTEAAVATSGDYRNYFVAGGRRYAHVIDPTTGRPVSHTLASVTVIADDCAQADGLATALLVMGPERGLEFSEKQEIAALLVTRTDDGYQEFISSRFRSFAGGQLDETPGAGEVQRGIGR